jgi:hypothetical protein
MRDREEKTARQLRRGQRSLQKRQGKDNRMVHSLIKKTAEDMAAHYYEYAASHKKHGDVFYDAFPDSAMFVKYQWRYFIKTAKHIMTGMLADPMQPESYKQEIYHALLLDETLPYIEMEGQIVNVPH